MDKTPDTWASRRMNLAGSPLDYAPWLTREQWSVSEAAKLLCGRNPHAKIPGSQIYNRQRRVIDLIDQAFAAAQAGEMRIVRNALLPIHLLIEPASFMRWAIAQSLEIPPELQALGAEVPTTNATAAAVQERVVTIARTLKLVEPELTIEAIATHKAMRSLVSEREASQQAILDWVREVF